MASTPSGVSVSRYRPRTSLATVENASRSRPSPAGRVLLAGRAAEVMAPHDLQKAGVVYETEFTSGLGDVPFVGVECVDHDAALGP